MGRRLDVPHLSDDQLRLCAAMVQRRPDGWLDVAADMFALPHSPGRHSEANRIAHTLARVAQQKGLATPLTKRTVREPTAEDGWRTTPHVPRHRVYR